ncbi:hypothetical protein PAMP_022745 [Pampus punctatissimus]
MYWTLFLILFTSFSALTTNAKPGKSFKKEFLKAHNAYRAEHGAPPMRYNKKLNAEAQKWADHLLKKGSLGHSDTKDGENVYMMWRTVPLKLTGHFTQVVWKESTKLGVGMATDGRKVFVVGQYRPAGNMNMPGYFEKNVLPKGLEATGGDKGQVTLSERNPREGTSGPPVYSKHMEQEGQIRGVRHTHTHTQKGATPRPPLSALST